MVELLITIIAISIDNKVKTGNTIIKGNFHHHEIVSVRYGGVQK